MNYYNEIDPFAAGWLRELIIVGALPIGDVDERSITEVQPSDLSGYTQCHFFAGIGGWAYAMLLAGWPDERPVWTGSCPCQPFSTAGKGAGGDDLRHLWPAWFRLIRECRPDVVFGEQVEAAIAHGWLDLVCDDLEREDYAIGSVCLPAASLGAPHLRQRLWFVAHSGDTRREIAGATEWYADRHLGDSHESRLQRWSEHWDSASKIHIGSPSLVGCWASTEWLQCSDRYTRPIPTQSAFFPVVDGIPPACVGILRGAGNAIVPQVAAEVISAYLEAQAGMTRKPALDRLSDADDRSREGCKKE